MIINNIKIGDIIINEIKQLKDKGCFFTTYELFKILDNYLYQKEIFQLLNISQATYYKYKKEKRVSMSIENCINFIYSIWIKI